MTDQPDKPIHMTGKEYYELLRTTRRAALEEAAKAVCVYCREGESHSHKVCTASGIRKLIAAEQGQGQGK